MEIIKDALITCQLRRLLVKVTDLSRLADRELSIQLWQKARQRLQIGTFAGAIRAEDADLLSSLEPEAQAAHRMVLLVSDHQSVTVQDILASADRRDDFLCMDPCLILPGFWHSLHPLQHLCPGPGKCRFSRFVPESGDQLLQTLNFRLLCLILPQLALMPFLLFSPVRCIVSHIPSQFSA